jgi:hypothetical protein
MGEKRRPAVTMTTGVALRVVAGVPLLAHAVFAFIGPRQRRQTGIPEPFVQALLARYARELRQAAPVTGEVERVLGRPARTYAEWVADHAAAFRAPGS